MDKFDDLLLQVIDKTVRYVFGDINAGIIYDYLQKNGCAFYEIPTKPSAFSIELRKILGPGRGQLLGAAAVLEETILAALCAEMKIKFDKQDKSSFENHVKKLREVYNKDEKNRKLSSKTIVA
ncbi:MAG: hypothetical protein ABSB89_04735 [Candidatus Bathyarchaeia archaeon]